MHEEFSAGFGHDGYATIQHRRSRVPSIDEMVAAFWHEYARRMAADTPAQRRRIMSSVSTIFPYTPPWERQEGEK